MKCIYQKDQPWIVIHWVVSEEEADANGGACHVIFNCAVCGNEELVDFTLPAADDPIWKQLGRAGCRTQQVKLADFKRQHWHPAWSRQNPVLTWAKPLLNPLCVPNGVSAEDLEKRLKYGWALSPQRNTDGEDS